MGFGSRLNPYVENPFAGRLTKVHWKKKQVAVTHYLTVRDSALVPPSTGGFFFFGWSKNFHSAYFGVQNRTADRQVNYTLSASDIGAAGGDSGAWSGTVAPGQRFIVVVWPRTAFGITEAEMEVYINDAVGGGFYPPDVRFYNRADYLDVDGVATAPAPP